MNFGIEEIQAGDQQIILTLIDKHWGGDPIIVHNEIFRAATLDGLKAVIEDEIIGFLHYQIRADECEILTLLSLEEGQGIGLGLINKVESIAREKYCTKLTLITTNDNLHALGFYQRHGFHLTALFPGQVDISRKIKPSIPAIGNHRIPLRDELQLEKRLN